MSLAFDQVQIEEPKQQLTQTFNTLQLLKKDHLQPAFNISLNNQCQSNRGLKFISAQLKNLLIKNKKLAYQEISRILVQNFGGQTKQEKNIKRRVYDAINVLLAIGIIIKQGNSISINYNSSIHQKFAAKDQLEQQKNRRTTHKKKMIKKLKAVQNNLAMLVLRNKKLKKTQKENKIIMQSLQLRKFQRVFEKVSFPGFFVQNNQKLDLKFDQNKQKIIIQGEQDGIKYFSFQQSLQKLNLCQKTDQKGIQMKNSQRKN